MPLFSPETALEEKGWGSGGEASMGTASAGIASTGGCGSKTGAAGA
ncbi:MAG: hypothetical protein IT285_07350 [Bdellovibrionales bacterium]|nr:hypothetical protein [Bdellovibrionales bacterium]